MKRGTPKPPPEGRAVKDGFTKVSDELIKLGLSPRLVMLYGRIVFHFNVGECFQQHKTLAKEIGLTSKGSREYILRLLKELHRLRLIEWKRGRYSNTYTPLPPDREWISGLLDPDVKKKSHLEDGPDVTLKSRQMRKKSHIWGGASLYEKNFLKEEESSSSFPVEVVRARARKTNDDDSLSDPKPKPNARLPRRFPW